MKDQPIKAHPATARGEPHAGQTGARWAVDAVGRVVAVGDTVTALRGRSVSRAIVERVGNGRLVLRRGDGMKALVSADAVVVLGEAPRGGTGVAS